MPWKSEADHVAYQARYNKAHAEEQRARAKARYRAEREYGKERLKGMDVDHRIPLDQGGSNEPSNTRLRSIHSNRGFRRDAKNNPL